MLSTVALLALNVMILLMTSYKKYLRIAADGIVERRKKCIHSQHFDEIVFYKKCKDCGGFVPFRNPEDILIRGVMPQCSDHELDPNIPQILA